MDLCHTTFLLLYGVFWAEMLATSGRYNGFPTAKLCAEFEVPGDRVIWWRRLVVSLLVLNAFPILWLIFLYNWVIPNSNSSVAIAAAGLAALSIYGILRVYHGIVASENSQHAYFTKAELKEPEPNEKKGQYLDIQGPAGKAYPRRTHIVPGVVYLLVFPGLAWIIARLFSNTGQ